MSAPKKELAYQVIYDAQVKESEGRRVLLDLMGRLLDYAELQHNNSPLIADFNSTDMCRSVMFKKVGSPRDYDPLETRGFQEPSEEIRILGGVNRLFLRIDYYDSQYYNHVNARFYSNGGAEFSKKTWLKNGNEEITAIKHGFQPILTPHAHVLYGELQAFVFKSELLLPESSAA